MKFLKTFTGLNGNGSNTRMSIDLQSNLKYYTLFLRVVSGTVALANFTFIRYKVNGKVMRSWTGTQLDEYCQRLGITAFNASTNPVVTIPLNLYDAKDTSLLDLTAINVGVPGPQGVIANFVLEMELSGATNPVFEVAGLVSKATPEGPGLMLRNHTYTMNGATTETGFTNLDVGTDLDRFLRMIMISPASGTISSARVETDGKTQWDAAVDVENQASRMGGQVIGSYFGYNIAWTPDQSGNLTPVLDKAGNLVAPSMFPYPDTRGLSKQDVPLYVTNSGAVVNTIILETLGNLG